MMTTSDLNKVILERWSNARKSAVTTTGITLVLFGALIVSWLSMWEGVHKYRSAIASRLWTDRKNHLLDDNDAVVLGRSVKAELNGQAILRSQNKPERYKLLDLAKKVDVSPYAIGLLDQLKQKDPNSFEAQSLQSAIAIAESQLLFANGQNFKRFHARRATAEKTTFKLLGLDFSVNGFWAWIVWLSFLTGGVFYLWLARRALIREGRRVGQMREDVSLDPATTEALRDSLPLWARPLGIQEKWARLCVSNVRTDLASDPLGASTLVLMAVCLLLSIAVIKTGIISTSLLRSEKGVSWAAVLHAVVLCTLVGTLAGLITSWFAKPGGSARNPEIIGRRTLLLGVASAGLAGLFYVPNFNLRILKSILNERRHRFANAVRFRRRRPKLESAKMFSGFYVDARQRIHYVPATGHSRSLASTKGPVLPWNGPFDIQSLRRVHHRAKIPFIRLGVTEILKDFRHRSRDQIGSAIQSTAWRSRHIRAFKLVQAELYFENERATRTMPNLQLYDLLGAIAINSGLDALVLKARQLLQSTSVQDFAKAQPAKYIADTTGAIHSHHSGKRAKGTIAQDVRRRARLDTFKHLRLGMPTSPQPNVHAATGLKLLLREQGAWRTPVDPTVANYIHVLRKPRNRQRKRLHVNSRS